MLDEVLFRQRMNVQRLDPFCRRALVDQPRVARFLRPERIRDELSQLRQRKPDLFHLVLQVCAPDPRLRHGSGFAIERAPVLVLPLPGPGASELQIELIGIGKHAPVAFFDELTAAFRHQPVREIAQAIHSSSDAFPRLEQDDGPSRALKLVRGGESGEPPADDCNSSIV